MIRPPPRSPLFPYPPLFRSAPATTLGIGSSRAVVLRLSGLFALDSFAGGFVIQSFAAYWFYLRFGVNPATLGMIFFWAKDRKSTRLNSSHSQISYAVFCLKK